MDQERIRVLNMVKEGKVAAEEAVKILEALETAPDEASGVPETKAKWFRLRVTDLKTGKAKVSLNLPMGIVDWALRTGTRVASSFGGPDLNGMGIDVEGLRAVLSHGVKGKFLDVTDDEQGMHVEITIE